MSLVSKECQVITKSSLFFFSAVPSLISTAGSVSDMLLGIEQICSLYHIRPVVSELSESPHTPSTVLYTLHGAHVPSTEAEQDTKGLAYTLSRTAFFVITLRN